MEHADAPKDPSLSEAREEIERLRALVDACAPYLKEGETPRERIEREFEDNQALLTALADARRDRDIHNGQRRAAEAKLMALGSGGVVGGCVLVPVEPTDEMLSATCDENGRMRVLEFTSPEERSAPFLVPRYVYRAMVKAARTAASVLENSKANLADANSKDTRLLRERVRELSAALEPFAKASAATSYFDDELPLSNGAVAHDTGKLTVGDLRRARSVLAQGVE